MEDEILDMPSGAIVRLNEEITWGPRDYLQAVASGHPLPEHNTDYYCTGSHQDVCPNCDKVHQWIGIKEIADGDQIWQASSFHVVRGPLDVDNLILDAFASGGEEGYDDHKRDGEVD
jgi:hypothetical protein